MKAFFLTLSFLLFWLSGNGQFVEFFDDNELTINPTWTGDLEHFTVSNSELRLAAPAVAATSKLSTASKAIANATWQFKVTMEFNPSSNNYCRIYLTSIVEDLSQEGYFIMLGGTEDEVSLYRQDRNGAAEIIDGKDGRLGTSVVNVEVMVTRDQQGNWSVYSFTDTDAEKFYDGSVFDDSYKASNYFGIQCTYTSTRSDKFVFDDLQVAGEAYTDTERPVLTYAKILGADSIILSFNEAIDQEYAQDPANYILNGNLTPSDIQPGDSTVLLNFIGFELLNQLKLAVSDLSNNILDTTIYLDYAEPVPPRTGDVIINEIMYDPSPPEDLPETEFVELLNTTKRVINMHGWLFGDRTRNTRLEEFFLYPDSTLILTMQSGVELMSGYGKAMGLSPWPSLNNSGDHLSLYAPDSTLINYVDYTAIIDDLTASVDGGVSLEVRYPLHACPSTSNWSYSLDRQGGTPGRANSVYIDQDILTPLVENASYTDSSLVVTYSEPINVDNIQFRIEPHTPSWQLSASVSELEITFENKLQESVPHFITLTGVQDCHGNEAASMELELLFPSKPSMQDVIFNEILFNPYPEGEDFIELKNLTNKYFDISKWQVSNGEITRQISDSTSILKPFSFAVLTRSPQSVEAFYISDKENFVISNIPAMNNDQGALSLTANNTLLDTMAYNESQHLTILTDVEGVSLERISPGISSLERQNWVSASSTVDFASPGFENSQNNTFDNNAAELVIHPEVIVPDNFGQDEYCTVAYNLDKTGYLASIKVYNLHGQLVAKVAENETIGTQGSFIWDGFSDQGSLASTGHYLLKVSFMHVDGTSKEYIRKVVVANGF